MTWVDNLASISVILAFGIWAYSKVKQQSIMETINEIKEIFTNG
jgi:type IV secretory pathway TrbL component